MIDPRGRKVTYYGYTGLIDSTGVTRLCQALNMAVNNQADLIYLCFSSPGGLVGDGRKLGLISSGYNWTSSGRAGRSRIVISNHLTGACAMNA
jgi:hypothetical protein